MLPDLFPRRPGARLILGGPGWDRDRIPAPARAVDTLPDALSEVAAALGVLSSPWPAGRGLASGLLALSIGG